MNKAFSSKKANLTVASSATSAKSCAKTARRKKKGSRSPLQDFNSMSSGFNSCDSSNTSIEAPKGCLKFFLAHSSSKIPVHKPKNILKTPNSAPNALPLKQSKYNSSKENLPKGSTGEHTEKLKSEEAQKFQKNSACLYQWKSGKKSGSRIGQKSKACPVLNDHDCFLPRLSSPSEEKDSLQGMVHNAGNCAQLNSCHNDSNLTPLSKQASESDLDSTVNGNMEENTNISTSKTPPIQNSVFPEIQCGSTIVSTTTAACYGTGYVVSGVNDKRKCRPRGILTAENKKSGCDRMASDSFYDDEEKEIRGVDNSVNAHFLPLPIEASMRWLLSPQNKAEERLSRKSKSGLDKVRGLPDSTSLISSSSPSSSNESYLDISDSRDLSRAVNGCQRKSNIFVSPTELPEFQGFLESMSSPYLPVFYSPASATNCNGGSSGTGKNHQNNPVDEKTPFSLHSFGCENVIQTPLSDSASDLHVGLSRFCGGNPKEDNSNLDLNSVSEVLPSTSLLLNSSMPLVDSFNSSFRFDCLTVPSDSFDCVRLPKFLDDQDQRLSSSTVEHASQSNVRISWREGLMSRLYELDEFDCCRCLSDEEDLANECSSKKLQIPLGPHVEVEVNGNEKLNNDIGVTETCHHNMGIDGIGKEMFPTLISCSVAESASTDGGDLFASSGDSDWTSCYKNKLYEV